MMDTWQIIGFAASLSGTVAFLPEVISAFKTRELKDIAWGMLFLYFLASSLWASYGILTVNYPLIIGAGVNIIMEIILMVLKKKYEMAPKPIFAKNEIAKENLIVKTFHYD